MLVYQLSEGEIATGNGDIVRNRADAAPVTSPTITGLIETDPRKALTGWALGPAIPSGYETVGFATVVWRKRFVPVVGVSMKQKPRYDRIICRTRRP
jgi:hypothetical protein